MGGGGDGKGMADIPLFVGVGIHLGRGRWRLAGWCERARDEAGDPTHRVGQETAACYAELFNPVGTGGLVQEGPREGPHPHVRQPEQRAREREILRIL